MTVATPGSVTVIGAGFVGLCVAFYARKAGLEVTVVEPEVPGSQCSFGNAGAISSGAIAPLAMPGVLRSAPKMLVDRSGPLYLPASYLLQAAPWLARFVAAARPERVEEIAQALHWLLRDAVHMHKELAAEAGCPQLIRDNGQLHLYPSREAMSKDDGSWALKRRYGLNMAEVARGDIRDMEPAVANSYGHGYYLYDQAWIAEPFRYSAALEHALRHDGVQFVCDRALRIEQVSGGWRIHCTTGQRQSQHVVVAAGAWSAQLLRTVGLQVPLESQRGYHVQIASPGVTISRPVVLADRKVFMTPMSGGLRVAGTVEFGGLSRPANARRAALLARHATAGLPSLDAANASTWMGHRPCLPDSLPVIGPVPRKPGLWCAFGHGHLGMTGGVHTGRLVAAAITDALQPEQLAPYAVSRFR